MGISINGPSGIDTAYIIDSLVKIEQTRVTSVERQKSAYQIKIDAYSQLKSLLTDFNSKASQLGTLAGFDLFSSVSSNADAVNISAGVGATEGRYDVNVFSLARAEKMISADNLITNQDASLSSLGISTGTISVGGVEIEIDDNDTIKDLRMKINNATDADGKRLGVTATVISLSETNHRLVLSAKETGAQGVEYADISGSVLQDLGIIDDTGGKGNAAQSLRSGVDMAALFGSLSTGSVIQYGGTDHNGNQVSATFIVSENSTIDDFLEHVGKNYHGMVEVAVDVDGTLLITDKITGESQLTMNSLVVDGAAVTMAIDTAGTLGRGVMVAGSDAYFAVDNLFMNASKNTIDQVIAGLTFELKDIAVNQSVSVEIKRDTDAIEQKVKDLLGAYNELLKFVKESTAFGNPEDENSTKGKLAGDMTISTIMSQVRSVLQTNFGFLGGQNSTLTMIGVKTDSRSGELELDGTMFKKVAENNYDELTKLFVNMGYSDNSNVMFGRSTQDTSSGIYIVEEVDAQHFRIRLENSSTWYTSDARVGDIVTFSDGPAKGLSLTASSGVLEGTSATFTFSRGISGLVETLVDKLNDSREGLVSMRQESWRASIKRADERISRLEASIESYRLRLVKQFSAMEQTLSQLQSQSSNMMSALGTFMYSNKR